MEKNKNEMIHWFIFIVILIIISISIILYFRLPKSVNKDTNNNTVTHDTIIVN